MIATAQTSFSPFAYTALFLSKKAPTSMRERKRDPNEGLPFERPGEPLYEKEGREADVILARKRSATRKLTKKKRRAGEKAK